MIQDDIREALARMPVGTDPALSAETKGLYARLLGDADAGVSAELDQAYGEDERQRLDVYHCAGLKHDAIVIYVPGGGYTGGDKRSDATFFANVGSYFAKRGILGITMNYRLAPASRWPAGAEDVAGAVAWARSNAAQYSANSGRVFVMGHSAGASHVASFLFDPVIQGEKTVAGGILISGGAYAVRASEARGNVVAYFGADPTLYERRSALSHVEGTTVPVLLACAEHDPAFLVTPTLEMAIAITRRDGRCPPLLRLEGHNHFSPPLSLGTTDDDLGAAVRRFVETH